MTDDAKTLTDINDKSWDDIFDADHSIKRELASERDGVDGNASGEQITAEVFAFEGRADEVPDEYQHYISDVEPSASDESDDEASDGDEMGTQVVEGEDEPELAAADEREDDDEAEDDARNGDLGSTRDTEPTTDSTFIIDADVLVDYLNHVSALVDEAKIHIDSDGLTIRAVDPANVGMVDTTVERRAFESFNVGIEGIIGVNIDRLDGVLKGADAGQLVAIDYDAHHRNLVVTYGGHEFTIALIDPASIRKEPDLPDLDLPVRVEMATGDLKDAIRHSDMVSDHAGFGAHDDVFEIHAEGDTDSYTWTGEGGEDVTFISPPGDDEFRSLFSLDYLKDLVATYEVGHVVTIDLGREFPARLTSALHHDDEEVGTVTYMVAPRITSD